MEHISVFAKSGPTGDPIYLFVEAAIKLEKLVFGSHP